MNLQQCCMGVYMQKTIAETKVYCTVKFNML